MDSKDKLYPSYIIQGSIESYLSEVTIRSKAIFLIVLVFIALAIASLPFIYLDVTVLSTGLIQSNIEKQPIKASLGGKIIYTNLKNNTKIGAGDTLLVLDTVPINNKIRALKFQLQEHELFIKDLNTLNKFEFNKMDSVSGIVSSPKYRNELDNFQKQLLTSKHKVEMLKSEHSRNITLFKQKVISEVDFESSKFKLNSEQLSYNQLVSQQLSNWQNSLTQLKEEEVSIRVDLESAYAELEKHFIISPLAGSVQQSNELQVGNFVYPNLQIAELSPESDLIAVCYVKPQDIGLVKVNQDVKLQITAYNYSEWGFLTAKVLEVSDDIQTENGSNAFFKVKCKLSKDYLTLKNGYKGKIKKGMTLTSRIIVTNRSIFDLLFDKVDKWLNPNINQKN